MSLQRIPAIATVTFFTNGDEFFIHGEAGLDHMVRTALEMVYPLDISLIPFSIYGYVLKIGLVSHLTIEEAHGAALVLLDVVDMETEEKTGPKTLFRIAEDLGLILPIRGELAWKTLFPKGNDWGHRSYEGKLQDDKFVLSHLRSMERWWNKFIGGQLTDDHVVPSPKMSYENGTIRFNGERVVNWPDDGNSFIVPDTLDVKVEQVTREYLKEPYGSFQYYLRATNQSVKCIFGDFGFPRIRHIAEAYFRFLEQKEPTRWPMVILEGKLPSDFLLLLKKYKIGTVVFQEDGGICVTRGDGKVSYPEERSIISDPSVLHIFLGDQSDDPFVRLWDRFFQEEFPNLNPIPIRKVGPELEKFVEVISRFVPVGPPVPLQSSNLDSEDDFDSDAISWKTDGKIGVQTRENPVIMIDRSRTPPKEWEKTELFIQSISGSPAVVSGKDVRQVIDLETSNLAAEYSPVCVRLKGLDENIRSPSPPICVRQGDPRLSQIAEEVHSKGEEEFRFAGVPYHVVSQKSEHWESYGVIGEL